MKTQFLPDSFNAPTFLADEQFYFRVLDDSVAELDYEAVMSSRARLKSLFGLNSKWPEKNMTLEGNIASLQAHKREFESREAFAYSVFNHSNEQCLGSVYIDPSQSANYDCEVYFWLRNDSAALEKILYTTVLNWLTQSWPFAKIAFPGKEISWDEWAKELS